MVATKFIGFVEAFKVTTFVGLEDFADRCSFIFSVIVYLLAAIICVAKTYLTDPISCYIPTSPSGKNFDKFINNYCWVHGTISVSLTENLPGTRKDWDKIDDARRINYYQWIPFVMAIQALLFFIPRTFWQSICYNRTGADLESLIETAGASSGKSKSDKSATAGHVARSIAELLYHRREIKHGRLNETKHKLSETCNFLFMSKRVGNWMTGCYMFIKLFYVANAIFQLYLMHNFLQMDRHNLSDGFGLAILKQLWDGKTWRETRMFPRVTFCHVKDVRHLGAENNYVAQCALPINMLYEKIYIFLWFWTVLVLVITVLSIFLWIYRMSLFNVRRRFLKKLIRMGGSYDSVKECQKLDNFLNHFLRYDGVFLMRLMAYNCGDLIASDVAYQLWEIYSKKFEEKSFRTALPIDSFPLEDKKSPYSSKPTYTRHT